MRALLLVTLLVTCAGASQAACTPPASPASSSPVSPTSSSSSSTKPGEHELFQNHGAVIIDTPAGPLRFAVELAITNEERQHGLMFREHLDDEAGMLFLFEKPRIQSFWMKNTRIPLDMLFIAEDGTIAGIVESAEPLTTVSRKVDKESRYVLELNGGAARKLGIAAGQRVRFEGVAPELVDARVLASASPPPSQSPAPSTK
jgi:hypothetical protein